MYATLEQLNRMTRESPLAELIDERRIRCLACGHRCPIFDGQSGICKVRFHRGGELYAPYGYVAGAHCDPIEKKPFFHVLPGSMAYSFGMLGCNLHCAYCQNWITSQTARDPRASFTFAPVSAEQLVQRALAEGATSLISTYNEPLITAEWAADVFRLAHQAGLLTGFVSNGNATPEVLEFLAPHLDLFKVDLKCFRDPVYRRLGGRLEPVLDSITRIHQMGFWLEVVTLLVPGLNDSEEELRDLSRFLAGISPEIPWHVTAFHPDYKMLDGDPTGPELLRRAAAIGRQSGLKFVYAGNVAGRAGELESTYCPRCGELLVKRVGFVVLQDRLTGGGACGRCGERIPGVWWRPTGSEGKQSWRRRETARQGAVTG